MPRAFIWHWGQLICRNCWLCLTICCNVLLLEKKKDDKVMTVILLTFWTDLYSHLKKIVFRAVFAAALWKAKYTQSTFKSNNIFFHKKILFSGLEVFSSSIDFISLSDRCGILSHSSLQHYLGLLRFVGIALCTALLRSCLNISIYLSLDFGWATATTQFFSFS